MSTQKPSEIEWKKGDIAVRKGRLCTIIDIDYMTVPPSCTVKMHDDGNEIGTEFSRLTKPPKKDTETKVDGDVKPETKASSLTDGKASVSPTKNSKSSTNTSSKTSPNGNKYQKWMKDDNEYYPEYDNHYDSFDDSHHYYDNNVDASDMETETNNDNNKYAVTDNDDDDNNVQYYTRKPKARINPFFNNVFDDWDSFYPLI